MQIMYQSFMMTVMLICITWTFCCCFKQRIGALEYPALITDWKSNMDGSAYNER